ncbi:hypothetical protein AMELA_G00070650 [Ameiurus melas]|uniref:Uncharacterized protein n=1 Tax=Ameiurus melas TaxID=219545 RepID=A0A7J6B5V1_AMEME|nr:hypothetical protein AMELA_G00070650 [Ameiurus melas]
MSEASNHTDGLGTLLEWDQPCIVPASGSETGFYDGRENILTLCEQRRKVSILSRVKAERTTLQVEA